MTAAPTASIATEPAIPTPPPSGISDPGTVEGGTAAMTLAVAATASTAQATHARGAATSTAGNRKITAPYE